MQHRHTVAEHGAKPIHRLRRQGDLRYEHDRRLAPLVHDATEQLDVDQRLAAACHAVQQTDLARLRCHECADRRSLCRRGAVAGGRIDTSCGERVTIDHLVDQREETALVQRLYHRGRAAHLLDQQLDGGATADRFEVLIGFTLTWSPGKKALPLEQRWHITAQLSYSAGFPVRVRCSRSGKGCRQRRADRDPQRDGVVIGHPLAQRHERRVEDWRGIGDVKNGLGRSARRRCIGRTDTDPHDTPRAERNDDPRPGHQRMCRLTLDCVCERLE